MYSQNCMIIVPHVYFYHRWLKKKKVQILAYKYKYKNNNKIESIESIVMKISNN